MIDIDKGIYARCLNHLRTEFFPAHYGKTFTSDDVYRFFQVDRRPNAIEAKKALAQVLYNLSHVNKKRDLEQYGKTYRLIDRTLNTIEWWKATKGNTLKLYYPEGVDDGTSFGFEESIRIYPKDLIVIAGEGNSAKTTWCLNFMVRNMEKYPCFYFTTEFNDEKFIDRMAQFDWVDLYKKDGVPRFELI